MSLPAPHPDRTCLVTGASSGIGESRSPASWPPGASGSPSWPGPSRSCVELAGTLAARHGVRVEVAPDRPDRRRRPGRACPAASRSSGLSVNVLVNNAGFSTLGPVYRADPDREMAMVRTDVEAVVHLCVLFTPGMVERRSGCHPQRGLDRGVPADSRTGRLRRVQGLRALLQPRHPARSCAPTVCRSPRCARDRSRPGSPRRPASPPRRWRPRCPSCSGCRPPRWPGSGVDGMDDNRAVAIPGLPNKASAAVGWLSPRRVLLPMVARQHPGLPDA